jgi:segregation and condensation protein B
MTEQTPPSTGEAAEEQILEQPADEASQTEAPIDEAPVAAPKGQREVPVPKDLPLRVEAVLMSTDRAINAGKLSEILGGVATKPIREAVDELNKVYTSTNRSFRIEQLAGGWQIVTLPQYAQILADLHKSRQSNKLTAAALETLAIIAYKQPVLRAEIEAIRGVSSGETVRSLLERHLVKIVGRAEEIGRPMLYGTTRQFLEVFGLATLKDLPNAGELRPPKPRQLIPAKDELDSEGVAPSESTTPAQPAAAPKAEAQQPAADEAASQPEEASEATSPEDVAAMENELPQEIDGTTKEA